jgi:hypothetical protein
MGPKPSSSRWQSSMRSPISLAVMDINFLGYLHDATNHYGLWFLMVRYVCGVRCTACCTSR